VGTSSSIIAKSVGTQESTVTPAAVSSGAKPAPARIISCEPGTSAAPDEKASQISSTDASNAMENPWKTRSSGRTWNMSPSARAKCRAL